MSIILYDFSPSPTRPGTSVSSSVWKTRFCLNYKNLAHRTEFIEAADIESLYKTHSIPPTNFNPDGTPRYTLPLIYDASTQRYISDSLLISQYLEETYPDPERSIFPSATGGLQVPLDEVFLGYWAPGFNLFWSVDNVLSPSTVVFLLEKYGKRFEEPRKLPKEVHWAAWKEGLNKAAKWYSKAGEGPFIMGKKPSWGDFVVGSYFVWLKVLIGEDSLDFQEVISWNGGIWAQLLHELHKWEKIY